jgi:beta-lactamase regulating signal transducer with metallopeptidase domain
MNSFVETLNHWGGIFLSFAWPMFWQSSLLIALLFAFDFLFRRKLRASIRYALWLVVLVKLCVPPTLALPTSPAWWLHKIPSPIATKPAAHYTVTYDNAPLLQIPQVALPVFVPPKPAMNLAASLLVISTLISSALFLWLLVRWWQITRQVRRAKTSERLAALADEAQKFVGMKFKVQVKLATNSMSPAVCGLFRPAILIPQSLAENFSDGQLRAVLLHELIHLRRRDVWVNFAQALLQIFYWWHPLVWLANARIRRVREEAVDDAVMLTLRDEAESYAPTLLEVAKLALNRPLASLGLVGIMESRNALRQRIERLVDFRPPRQAGLTLVSLLGILAFTAVAVPMGGAPEETNNPTLPVVSNNLNQTNSSISATTNLSANTNSFEEYKPGRQFIVSKLDRFRLAQVNFRQLSLGEVVRQLNEAAWQSGVHISTATNSVSGQLADINSVGINLPSPLKDARLADVLDAIVQAASKPIKYSVMDDGIFFSLRSSELDLYTRTFKVDPNTFVRGLRELVGTNMLNATGSQTNNVSTIARSFFSALGVDLTAPGKAIFFNDRLGMLFVRATDQDLDTIERVVEILNQVTPQIHIKARFFEVPKGTVAGFGRFLNSTNPAAADQFTGILTATNAKVFLHSLESRKGVEDLAEPEVVTTSGRQTQMRATDIITVVTNFVFQKNLTNEAGSIAPQVDQVEVGPILDVVPYVLSDGYTINLTLIPSLTEFVGYDTPPDEHLSKNDPRVQLPVILPRFSIRQVVTTLNLWDGQTVVLGGLKKHFRVNGKEVTEKSDNSDSEMLIFITATIVDPAGNRVHAEDELPFAQKGIPPQPQPK